LDAYPAIRHLPDLTVITPCFDSTDPSKIIFFTASRGRESRYACRCLLPVLDSHRADHSDIGGILPGSMPPTSTALYEEGAEIRSLKIVSAGMYNGDQVRQALVDEPAKYPGCSGCRNFRDVESDLKAQVAANHKGSELLRALVEEYGLGTVHEYMEHIRK
jgi:5-oxoprolinase (ATP-hydrolysing)